MRSARRSIVCLDGVGDRQVERVRRLPRLEEHVRVLGRYLGATGCSGESARARCARTRRSSISARRSVVVERLDLVDLVRGAEPVEEVQEWDPRLERRGVGDEREVLGFLHRRGAEHREAGRPRSHHVAVIAEDRQRVGRHGAGRDVHHERRQLTCDLEHVGIISSSPCEAVKVVRARPTWSAPCSAPAAPALALHLDDVGHGAPQVRAGPATTTRRRARPSPTTGVIG